MYTVKVSGFRDCPGNSSLLAYKPESAALPKGRHVTRETGSRRLKSKIEAKQRDKSHMPKELGAGSGKALSWLGIAVVRHSRSRSDASDFRQGGWW